MAPAFVVCDSPAVLARVPLRPAETDAVVPRDGDALLAEAVFLASRQAAVNPSARPAAAARPGDSRMPTRGEATRRAYELRSRWRPTPHGAFAGVAIARIVS